VMKKILMLLAMVISFAAMSVQALALPWDVKGSFVLGMENQTGYKADYEGNKMYDVGLGLSKEFYKNEMFAVGSSVSYKKTMYPEMDKAVKEDQADHNDTCRLEVKLDF
jgi:hypothetical protein